MIYEYLKGNNKDFINLKQIDRDECIESFEEYKQVVNYEAPLPNDLLIFK